MLGTAAARRGKGKMRPPKKTGPDTAIEEGWIKLSNAIKVIQAHNASSLRFEEIHRYAYNMVLYKHGDKLYAGVKKLIAEHLQHLAITEIVPTFPRRNGLVSGGLAAGESTSGGSGGGGNANGNASAVAGPSSSAMASRSASASGSGRNTPTPNATANPTQSNLDFPTGGLTFTGLIEGSQAVEMVVDGERFLKAIKFVWDDHSGSLNKLRQVLKYMDKVYTEAASVQPVSILGLHLFLSEIIHSTQHPIHSHLLSTFLTQIHLERSGEIIDRTAMRHVVEILNSLEVRGSGGRSGRLKTVYQEELEPVVLGRSREFYKAESEGLLESCDCSTYLKKVETRLVEENARSNNYLLAQTTGPLIAILEEELLSQHLQEILDMPGSGLVPMLDDERFSDLQRMYKLFSRPGVKLGMTVLKAALRKSIDIRGTAINGGTVMVMEGVASSSAVPAPSSTTVSGSATPAMDVDVEMDVKPSRASLLAATRKGKGKENVPPAGPPAGSSSTDLVVPSATSGQTATVANNAALDWVRLVLELKDKFDRILRDGFGEDKAIQTAINEAFQTFINSNNKAPEYISLFIDDNLKKGLKGKTEDEVELVLEKTIILFRFLIDKDIFERYYKAHLAKRLLNGRSVSEDAERSMVAKLRVESGNQFTQKLEGMFNDMRLSKDTMKAFERHLTNTNNQSLGMDLSVTVLGSNVWPGEGQSPCVFPPVLKNAIAVYERFYQSRHDGRRLTWQGQHGTAEVKIQFKSRKHEVTMSTHALVVLLLFEDLDDDEQLSLQAIRSATQIPDTDLARTLQSMACGKFRILNKSPKGRDIGKHDTFSFNSSFSSPLARFKIQAIVGKVENKQENAETQERIEEERKHVIEACIVRIMKNRKTLSHGDLINEVVRQLGSRFVPTSAIIKKRIEGLIDREYLERNGMNSYNYLA